MKKRKPRYPLPCEYRQTKEYKLSDQGGEYTIPHKGAEPVEVDPSEYDGDVYPEETKKIKKRTMNELRQTKEYYVAKQKVLSDGGFDTNEEMKQIASCVKEIAEIDPVKHIMAQQIEEECPLDPVEEAKILIVHKITKHFDDVMFEMVCKEMSNNYVFQSQNYLTEAGYEMFEDEWFEFYHEHHGDILYEVMQNITN